MALTGPIILVEDDKNDIETITQAIRELKIENEVLVFEQANEAYDYLLVTSDRPFLILCDIRMPVLDGLSFRKNICKNPELRKKSIPFIFLTGIVSVNIVNEAYDLDVQGFYQKAGTYERLKEQLLTICIYWKHCLHPNKDIK